MHYSLSEIAEAMGASASTICRWLAEHDNRPSRARIIKVHPVVFVQPSVEDIAARIAEMPKHDNRSLVGRIVGDPHVERSALYKRQQEKKR